MDVEMFRESLRSGDESRKDYILGICRQFHFSDSTTKEMLPYEHAFVDVLTNINRSLFINDKVLTFILNESGLVSNVYTELMCRTVYRYQQFYEMYEKKEDT